MRSARLRQTIGATTRKHSLVYPVKTLHTSGVFLQRPSLFTSRLRLRRAGFNTRRWQRRQRDTVVFIKTVWMIQQLCGRATAFGASRVCCARLVRGNHRLEPNIYLFRRQRNCFHHTRYLNTATPAPAPSTTTTTIASAHRVANAIVGR